MAPRKKPNTHWYSDEFDRLRNLADDAKDYAEYLQWLKKACLYAIDNAPPGTKTAGTARSKAVVDGEVCEVGSYNENINTLRRFLVKEGVLDYEENKHWYSDEFDRLMAYANETNFTLDFVGRLKAVYKFAKDNAPPGTITAGNTEPDFDMERVKIFPTVMNDREKGIRMSYPINLEELRCILKEHGFLAPEDSPE